MLTEAFSEAFDLITSANADLYEILWLSVQVSLTALVIASLLAMPLGTILAISEFRGRRAIITFFRAMMGSDRRETAL